MPQRRSGIKALRQNHARKMHNLDIKTDLKKTTKKFLASVRADNKDEAKANLNTLYKKLDKAAKLHILHENTAARRKSKYTRQLAVPSA